MGVMNKVQDRTQKKNWHKTIAQRTGDNPTNIASVHLVMGRPNARAGVKIVKKKRTGRTT